MSVEHQLGGSDTGWLFFAASREDRHLLDVALCVLALRQRGVRDDHILVFVDHPAAKIFLTQYQIQNVFPLSDFANELAQHKFHFVVATCGGHGSARGLDGGTGTAVGPYALYQALRTCASTLCVVFLCQCYAGLFNFMDARTEPPFVVIGATNFYDSVSMTDGLGWSANVYQSSLFLWLLNPIDVDGDGEITLIDAYKFAGVRSVVRLKEAWILKFAETQRLSQELADAEVRLKSLGDGPEKQQTELTIGAIRTSLNLAAELLYNIQEPWLLHANLARQVGFGNLGSAQHSGLASQP